MKRVGFIIFTFALLGSAFGQTTFGFGPRVGFSLVSFQTTFEGEPISEPVDLTNPPSGLALNELGVGAMAGVFTNVMFGDKFGIQAEANFSGEGTSYVWLLDGEAIPELTSQTRFRMLNIPITARVKFSDFVVFAGPQFATTRSIWQRQGEGEKMDISEEEWMSSNGAEKVDWTALVLGVEWAPSTSPASLDFRMSFGPEIGSDPDNGLGYKPFAASLTLAFDFLKLGKTEKAPSDLPDGQ